MLTKEIGEQLTENLKGQVCSKCGGNLELYDVTDLKYAMKVESICVLCCAYNITYEDKPLTTVSEELSEALADSYPYHSYKPLTSNTTPVMTTIIIKPKTL